MNKIRNSVKWSVYISHWLAWVILYMALMVFINREDTTSSTAELIFISVCSSLLAANFPALISYWCTIAQSKCLLFVLLGGTPLIFGSIGDISVLLFGRWFYTGTEDLLYFWRRPRTASEKSQLNTTSNTK